VQCAAQSFSWHQIVSSHFLVMSITSQNYAQLNERRWSIKSLVVKVICDTVSVSLVLLVACVSLQIYSNAATTSAFDIDFGAHIYAFFSSVNYCPI
jgi:hypothetical protein